MQCVEVSGAVRPIYGSLDVKRLIDIVMFDYIPFPVFIYTTGMAHFQVLRHNFLIFEAFLQDTLYIYVSKDVMIRGYLSKPKYVGRQKSSGNTAPYTVSVFLHKRYIISAIHGVGK